MSVTPNNTLGKYRVIREIARSNDIVYEALDPQMNRRVAIKELQLPQHLAGAQKRERIERFYREAKAAGTLSHPNIVTVFEVGQENDRHFIAMEYLEGQSLREILQMQGALPLRESLDIALQLCDALGFAHSHGVVHRDVKPDNVHILPGGAIKLTDFGIARLTAEPSITSQGQVFGTPSYMSPEQVASQNVDQRTDLFSLGITIYEMLSGRKPFTGDSVITITYNIMNLQPVMPIGVPPMLQGILQKALAKDPGLRYQNAAALAADLRAQKFELDSPTYQKTSPLTFGQPAPAINPPTSYPSNSHMPYHPTEYGKLPSQPSTGSYLPYMPPEPRISPQARTFLGLLFSIVGVIILLMLLVWGVSAALRTSEMDSRQNSAYQAEKVGQKELSTGNYDAAASAYQQAEKTAPQNSAAYNEAQKGLANVDVARGQQALSSGNTNGAQQAYQQALSVDSKNANAEYALGNLAYSQGDMRDAATDWEQASNADPTSETASQARKAATQVYQTLAQQDQQSGNINQARLDWGEIITMDAGTLAAQNAQEEIDATAPATASP